MKNKKSILILIGLIVIWGASFLFTGKGDKTEDVNEKYEYKKKVTNEKGLEAADFNGWVKRKTALVFIEKRNIFEREQNRPQKTENENENEKKPEKKEPIKVVNKKVKQPVESIPSENNNSYNMDSFKVDEEQLITTEMYNIEIHGVLLNGKSRIVFLMYKGNSYEIIDDGNLKIYANNKSYEIKASFYEEDYITFTEKTKNITVKKRVKE